MAEQSNNTVAYFDALEADTRSNLKTLTMKATALDTRRGDMLLHMADRDDKATRKELEGIEKEQKDLALEIEVIESLLSAIPKRRDLARADEIETEVDSLLELDQQLVELTLKINTAAENFVLTIREYYNILITLHDKNRLAFEVNNFDIGVIDAVGFFLRKYDLWRFIKVGSWRDATTMTADKNQNVVRHRIELLVGKMRGRAARLRGEIVTSDEWCPDCYGKLNFVFVNNMGTISNRKVCSKCGREIV